MATLFDAVVILKNLGFYETVFPFILILAVVYGMLAKLHPFGENKTVNATVSTIIALFFISIFRMSAFIKNFIPLITGFLLILVFFVLIFMFMGVKEETITKVLTTESTAYGALIIIFVLIVFVVLSQVFPEQAILTQLPGMGHALNVTIYPENATPSEKAASIMGAQSSAIIFSPQILAMIIMMLVFAIAAYYIVRVPKKGGGE
ncbi:MAG: hypothetical protein V1839_00325 [archaeon]